MKLLNIKSIALVSALVLSTQGQAASIYNDLFLPTINNCPAFLSGTAQMRGYLLNYSAWEGGRHNRRVDCYQTVPVVGDKTKKSKMAEVILASGIVKSGDTTESPSIYNAPSASTKKQCGSIIDVDSRTLGERIPLTNTPFDLIYFSSRAEGNTLDGKIIIPVSDPSPNITAIAVAGTYADGRTFNATFSNLPNQVYTFVWDNKDSLGNLMTGSTQVNFSVIYTMHGKDVPLNYTLRLGGWKVKGLKLGGWQPDIYHQYDFARGLLATATHNFKRQEGQWRNSSTEYHVPSDNAEEIYVFNSTGRHLKTLFGLTGSPKFIFTHNVDGLLQSITDGAGQVTTFNRDSSTKLVTSIVSPKGQVTTLEYNSNGELATVTNPSNESYEMLYSGVTGLLSVFTKPAGEFSSFTYDADGGLTVDEHSGGYIQSLAQIAEVTWYAIKKVTLTTGLGRKFIREIQNPLETTGESHATTTSKFGNGVHERNGMKTRSEQHFDTYTDNYAYKTDPRFSTARFLGRFTRNAIGKTSAEVYDRSVNLSDANDPFSIISMNYKTAKGADISTSQYNGTTKEWTSTSGEGAVSKTKIDSLERVTESQVGNLSKTQYTYLADGRIGQISQGERITKFYYDANGNLSRIIDPAGRSSSFLNDALGRTLASTSHDGRKTRFEYDSNSRLTKITTPHGKQHNFTYNGKELLESYFSPIIGSQNNETKYEYSQDKELKKVILPDLRQINYNYRALQTRLVNILTNESNYYYTYFGNPHMTSPAEILKTATTGDTKLVYTYTGDQMASEEFKPSSGSTYYSKINYQYDSKFRLSLLQLRDSTGTYATPTVYAYDKDDKLIQAGELIIKRDKTLGFISKLTLKNADVLYSVDSKYGELSKIEYRFNGTPGFTREYKRDKLGRIIEEATPEGTYSFFYDKAGRFTGRSLKNSGRPVSNFVYDANGNRIRGNDNGKTFKAEYDVQDRLVKYNNTVITYNLNGQVANKNVLGVGFTVYTYDTLGNLLHVALPTTSISYESDALGRRAVVKQNNTTFKTRYVWDGKLRVIAELSSTGTLVKRYVYAEGVNSPEYMVYQGRKYLFTKDHRGSINQVVDSETGEIKQKIRYSEWGEVLEDTYPGFQPFGFAGGLYDNVTKLYRFGVRDYDPEVGRWLSKDPIRFSGGDTNLYGYVLQDPVNLIDPNGHIAFLPAVGIGALVGGIFGAIGDVIANNNPTFSSVSGAFIGGAIGGASTVFFAGPAIVTGAGVGFAQAAAGAFGGMAFGVGIQLITDPDTIPPHPIRPHVPTDDKPYCGK